VLGGYKDHLDLAGKLLMASQLFRFRWLTVCCYTDLREVKLADDRGYEDLVQAINRKTPPTAG
jgi:hypothetical protein